MARRSPRGGLRHGATPKTAAQHAAGDQKGVSPFAAQAAAPFTQSASSTASSWIPSGEERPGSRGPAPQAPLVRHSLCLKRVKGEDLAFIREGASRARDAPAWSLFCLCDGGRGDAAARYVKAHLWSVLAPLLPRSPLPEDHGRDFHRFAMKVSAAVTEALLEVAEQFVAHSNDRSSGVAVTLALVCGRLLTVANVGDCMAVLDTGKQSLLATVSHRLEDSPAERRRLAEAGVAVAPGRTNSGVADPWGEVADVLRCYPSGLAVSRSVGNVEAGKHIIACPHICQAVVPEKGVRLLIGSSGLWNMIEWDRAAVAIRDTNIKAAAAAAVSAAVSRCGHACQEDTTALVLDVTAPDADLEQAELNQSRQLEHLGCCGGMMAFICGYNEKATAENWDMNRDVLLVVTRVDGLDLVKKATEQNDSRLSRLASGCLPWDATNAPTCSMPREWAPAFLTAQRATLGVSSSGGKWAPVGISRPTPKPTRSRSKTRRLSSCFTGESPRSATAQT